MIYKYFRIFYAPFTGEKTMHTLKKTQMQLKIKQIDELIHNIYFFGFLFLTIYFITILKTHKMFYALSSMNV